VILNGPTMRVRCPACHLDQTATPDAEGKAHCQACGQRMKLPAPPRNRTMLAGWSPPEDEAPPPAKEPTPIRVEIHHSEGRSRRRRGFECPYCGTSELPRRVDHVSAAGWVAFAMLLAAGLPSIVVGLLFWPCCAGLILPCCCWVGLLIRDKRLECVVCRQHLPE
jgi:hypothetical protein